MKVALSEKQYNFLKNMVEQETTSSSDSQPSAGTSDTQSGGQGYPQVSKWESGVERGPGNQIGVTTWDDVVGSKLTRGKANPLNEQPIDIKKYALNSPQNASDSTYRYTPNYMLIKPNNSKPPIQLDKFMEEFRNSLYSPAGIAIEGLLTALEFTAPAVVLSYAAMLGYDLYRANQGYTDWLNIIFDLLGLVSSGMLSGVLSRLMEASKPVLKSIESAFEWLSKQSDWKVIEPYVMKLVKLSSWALNKLVLGLKEIGKWLKSSWLGKMTSKLNSLLKPLFDYVEKITQKGLLSLGVGEKISQAGGHSAKIFAQQTAILGSADLTIKGIAKGLEAYLNYRVKNQIKNKVLDPTNVTNFTKADILRYYPGLFSEDDYFEITKRWMDNDTIKLIIKIKNQNYLAQISTKDYIYRVTPIN